MQIWLFQANDDYQLTEHVPARLGKGDSWLARRYRDDMEVGDKVILWQSGPAAGVYAFGELASTPYEQPSHNGADDVDWLVDIRYTEMLPRPVFKRELMECRELQDLLVLRQPFAANPFRVTAEEWDAVQELVAENTVNIFTHYQQKENQFTNGLMALLELSRHDSEQSPLLAPFLNDLLALQPAEEVHTFRVLRGIDGTADAELCSGDCCVRIETKIRSGTLREEQIRDHLERLKDSPAVNKVLVLLTPDNSRSNYVVEFLGGKHVRKFLRIDRHHRVMHLEWRKVYDHLGQFANTGRTTVLTQLVQQFLNQIRECVLEQDYAGIVQKIAFGELSGVDPATYLEEMRKGRRDRWNTPRKYEKLDGTGRKLLLYDKTWQAITLEVEIREVRKTNDEPDFPWTNYFVRNSLEVYRRPIPLAHILTIPGFENFAVGRSANWNVTREQYWQLRGKG